ncbi:hypothetical protein GOQ29_08895 [Clostridium sp. D2Q-14]|uniref:hypothetical protein n=1 Tax=Anaeromonas gelatinilytica TaxID=2683194 RepID=UPI00193AF0DD|nr:hypothetical protein [Anaeromonas gelatinilytica]MBS4535730.1 hypothetical protein [Anaeromonas gelatinilytica]
MGKKEKHKEDLMTLFDDFFITSNRKNIIDYLISNSNLPGRRANLELADAFGDTVIEIYNINTKNIWDLCKNMTEIRHKEIEENDPEEFISFCGLVGIGSISSVCSSYFSEGLLILKNAAKDIKWRIREAVAMGIQRVLLNDAKKIINELEEWIKKKDYYIWRAVVAGLAEPDIVKNKEVAKKALEIHKEILKQILDIEDRKLDSYKKLRQALGYTLSVVVEQIPKEGFKYINHIVKEDDKDIIWIVKSNLKKNRLLKKYPKEVERIKMSM